MDSTPLRRGQRACNARRSPEKTAPHRADRKLPEGPEAVGRAQACSHRARRRARRAHGAETFRKPTGRAGSHGATSQTSRYTNTSAVQEEPRHRCLCCSYDVAGHLPDFCPPLCPGTGQAISRDLLPPLTGRELLLAQLPSSGLRARCRGKTIRCWFSAGFLNPKAAGTGGQTAFYRPQAVLRLHS